jgi:glycosyltransferase involved in cell wall biosynthesis
MDSMLTETNQFSFKPIYDVAIVMPVYNEAACIAEVLNDWRNVLQSLKLRFLIIVLNDGSRDNTAEVLSQFASFPEFYVIHKPNSGHGSTILQGYRYAVEKAEWVFQCDSDNEMPAMYFPTVWEKRDFGVAIFGQRAGRKQNLSRYLLSHVARLTIKLFYGTGVNDVNVPYRLMQSKWLRVILQQLPEHLLTPNVIIAGTFACSGLPLVNVPIPFQDRRTGQVSIVRWKLWKLAFMAFWQTLRYRPRLS